MTVSPTVEIRPSDARIGPLTAKLARAALVLVAFALLSGVWLAFFTFVPFDFSLR
jgi:hypothetical protein